jgi:hypothetical protein
MALTLTYEIASRAAWDAGNRSARAAGRAEWDEQDWNAAAEEFERLWPEAGAGPVTAAPTSNLTIPTQ